MNKKILIALTFILAASLGHGAFINDPAPAFSLPDFDGKTVSLSAYQGNIVLVNFWASWCPPCKKEFPELNELANEYKGQKFSLVAISLDKKKEHVEKFLEKNKITVDALKVLWDPDAKVVADYVARSMPTSFILDKTGKIRFVHFGYSEQDPAKWRIEIDQLLSEGK